MSPDEERFLRYLEWKRAAERERADRRRRVLAYVAIPSLCLLAVGLAAWLEQPSRHRSPAVNAVAVGRPPQTARETTPTTAPATPDATAAAPEQPAVEPAPTARPQPRTAPSVASRPRMRPVRASRPLSEPPVTPTPPPAAPTDEGSGPSDVAAAVAPPPGPPATAPGDVPAEPRHETVVEQRQPAAPTPSDVVVLPSHPPETPVQSSPVQGATAVTTPASGGAVAVAPRTVRERVTMWANGEVDEFREGVKREVREFRSGYEKVRGLFRR